MPIVKNGYGSGDGTWWSVKCECCGRMAFNEATKEDAIEAVRSSDWAMVSSGGGAVKDYCPECFRDARHALDMRRKAVRPAGERCGG